MELVKALETYLVETGQIHLLAGRQARVLCRSVAGSNDGLQKEAQILLLLNLAALNLGAPRATRAFLLKPLEEKIIEQHVNFIKTGQSDALPPWEGIINQDSAKQIGAMADAVLNDPERLAPLTGVEPRNNGEGCPLLVIGTMRQAGCMGFSRFWRAAAGLEEKIRGRLRLPLAAIPAEQTAAALAEVFVTDSILEEDRRFHHRQVAAAALALRTRFMVVSGGPGTGKTWVVVQILRTLMRVIPGLDPRRIVLCAPTGRAKARLGESIDNGIKILEKRYVAGRAVKSDPDLGLKNLERRTLHGLLGVRPDGSMKYNAQNPLPHQVVVVDEASMVDLYLFSALLEAASDDCRILLVGDMHQLPSVEAGAVLGDLTGRFDGEGHPTLTSGTADWLREAMKGIGVSEGSNIGASSLVLSGAGLIERAGLLADHAIILTGSFRSTAEILAVSGYVNKGDGQNTLKAIAANSKSGVVSLDTREGQGAIAEWLEAHYTNEIIDQATALRSMDLGAAVDPSHQDHLPARSRLTKALAAFEGSRILTLTNTGPRGRVAINVLAEKQLRPRLSGTGRQRFFHGQQVVLSQNLHELDLFNGDTGMVLEPGSSGPVVAFRRGDGYSIHALERLTGLEPAFAMTVHKAQGSEFGAVMLVLPEYVNSLLTRQILYTGITRAKDSICILGTSQMLRIAIDTKEDRPGGIDLGE